MNTKKGFTLIELMITVAIMSILLTVGLPSFQSIIAGSRLTSAANAMVSALQLARTEALKQHLPVVIRKKGTKWEEGWNVFVDADNSRALNGSETILATFDKLNVITVYPDYANYAYYDEGGRINTFGKFSFCTSANNDFRSVVINNTGRVHVESTTSNPSSTYAADCN